MGKRDFHYRPLHGGRNSRGSEDETMEVKETGVGEEKQAAEASVEDLLRLLSRVRGQQAASEMDEDRHENEDEDNDEDAPDIEEVDEHGEEEDEDLDDDDEDDEEEDEDDEDEDEEDDDEFFSAPEKDGPPAGKRVILRSDYRNNKAYCDAVVRSMQSVLRKNRIRTEPINAEEDVKAILFDGSISGVTAEGHIICEYALCNYRIEFIFHFDRQEGRTALIDYFCQENNYSLRYGSIVMDHETNRQKMHYSSCFCGAFSEEAFGRYITALRLALEAYGRDYAKITGDTKLDREQRQLARRIIDETAMNLPGRVKPENEERYSRVTAALGGSLSVRMKKLLNYVIEHIR